MGSIGRGHHEFFEEREGLVGFGEGSWGVLTLD